VQGLSKELYEEINALEKDMTKLKVQLQHAPSEQTSARSHFSREQELSLKIAELWQAVALKASIKDVCALVDSKATVADVNASLEQLDRKWSCSQTVKENSVSDFDNLPQNQKFINDSLCALNCVAKWVWFGGFTTMRSQSTGFGSSAFDRCVAEQYDAIRWSKEVINTSPDSFELCSSFRDECGAIQIKGQGVYELVFAFFLP